MRPKPASHDPQTAPGSVSPLVGRGRGRPRNRVHGGPPTPAAAKTEQGRYEAGVDSWAGHSQDGLRWSVHRGDASTVLSTVSPASFHCAVTSPPYYWQRDYKVAGQIGQEPAISEYVTSVASVMDQLRRVLRPDGLLFLNLGDTYYSAKGQPKGIDRKNGARRFGLRAVDASGLGVPRKTSIGIPWRVALEMINRGWTLRSPIVWQRTKSLPEPTARDRPWRSYEMIFMFSRSPRYYFSRAALGGDEDVWTISDRPRNVKGIHSAAFPEELVQKCLEVGCPAGGSVLDPFAGSGTVPRVALAAGHPVLAIDLSPRFCEHIVRVIQTI